MADTALITCTCKSDFQDERYGKGVRVANVDSKKTTYVCTVCGKPGQPKR
jgi:hypothetical protein